MGDEGKARGSLTERLNCVLDGMELERRIRRRRHFCEVGAFWLVIMGSERRGEEWYLKK
jgi:hypothetical protein